MPAYRTDTRAGLPDHPAHQQKVDCFLDGGDAVSLLRQSHRPADDGGVGLDERLCGLSKLADRQAGGLEDDVEIDVPDYRQPLIETGGVVGDELVIEDGESP